jgi:hypothetical protein
MLLPTEEDTAISPKPFLATITLVMRSGMEVPAARNVKPITCNMIEVPTTVTHEIKNLSGVNRIRNEP